MSRPLGGYIGYDAEPAVAAAPGIWTLREAEFYQRKAQWPGSFGPTSLSGLQAWYDASDASTITESSGDVSQIDDKSGNDYHLTQATAALKPTYETAVQNGLNVLTIIEDGSGNRQMATNTNATFTAVGEGDYTAVSLARVNNTAISSLFNIFNGSGTNTAQARFNTDVDDFRIFYRDGSNNTLSVLSADNLWSVDEWYVMITVVSGTTMTLYQDNVQVATGDLTGISPSFTEYEFARTSGSMSIGEQVIYNAALSTEDRTLLYDYLVAKWGLA